MFGWLLVWEVAVDSACWCVLALPDLAQAKAITTATASATVFTAIPTVSSIPYIRRRWGRQKPWWY